MSMGIKREVTLTTPTTLDEMEEFIVAAREMGVPGTRQLDLTVRPGFSDQRERVSTPASATLTARP